MMACRRLDSTSRYRRHVGMGDLLSFIIRGGAAMDRADKVIADQLEAKLSRSAVIRLMKAGRVRVDGKSIRPAAILGPGAHVEIELDDPVCRGPEVIPEISVHILFEDDHIIILDKPAGLVVHPAAGHPGGTLVDVLVRTRPGMIGVGDQDRWGIVHRLDKDTTGVMVVAKTSVAHRALSARFKEHSIHRLYMALVRGDPGKDHGIIDTPLGRHPRDRKRVSTSTSKPRHAVTRWRVIERFDGLTLLEVAPETGRTHQIRVHLASVGLPVAGDRVYGRARKTGAPKDSTIRKALGTLHRQALHASVLGFDHPTAGHYLEFSTPLPKDMAEAVYLCKKRSRMSV